MSANDPPGGIWNPEDFLSAARMTRQMNIHLPGHAAGQPNDAIDTLNPTYKNMTVICTSTGGGYVQDVAYRRNSANTAWIGGGGGKHLHDADTDQAGGLFRDVLYANVGNTYYENQLNPVSTAFKRESGGTGTTVTDEVVAGGRIRLDTGTGAGAWTHLFRSGVAVSYDSKSKFIIKLNCSAGNNLTARVGVTAERVDDTPGASGIQSYGMEVCDSTGTDKNWDLFSGDGSNRSATGTANAGASVLRASATMYKWEYTPSTDVKWYISSSGGGTTPVLTKTSNVAAAGNVLGIRNFGFGIRYNAGSAKQMYVYGMAFVGRINESTFF